MEIKKNYNNQSINQYKKINEINEALYQKIKRITDILLGVVGIILLFPLFLVLYVIIKLSDPKQKVFFVQERVGKNECVFKMYKFRTMDSNAESRLEELLVLNEIDGPMFKITDDPRITKIGKVLRKYSIDELPQLLNVIKGDMSLVGPRPPLAREVKEYTTYDKQRLQVTPGCTGLWQVSGRNAVGFKEMVELDLLYISQKNIVFDLIIIFKTIEVMIKPNCAS